MQIVKFKNLIVNFGELSDYIKEEIDYFIDAVQSADTKEDLQTLYDDMQINGNTFHYAVKQNYQHVIVSIIGLTERNEVEITLKSYD